MKHRFSAFIALGAALVASPVLSQAWLPPRGEGLVSLNFQSLFVKDHIRSWGERHDSGHIRANSARLEVMYGLTDRFAVSGDILYVGAKYYGTTSHGPPDDRSFNDGFQDARVDLLYNALNGSTSVTPFVRAVFPVTHYSPQGHSARGRSLVEGALGTYVGRDFGPLLPDAYFQAGYWYSFVEHVQGVHTNRSNGELELAYSITPAFSARILGLWQETHGGFDLPRDWNHEGGFEIHDRVAKSQYIRFGAGVTYALNPTVGVYAIVLNTHSGKSTYASRGVSAGFSWSFSRGLSPARTPIPVE